MVAAVMPRKKVDAKRRSFNLSNDLYGKLQRVAHRERINATQQLERTLDRFFAEYEREHGIEIDAIELPVGDELQPQAGADFATSSADQESPIKAGLAPLEALSAAVEPESKTASDPS
jgi:hypothetical protein